MKEEERAARVVVMVAREEGTSGAGEQPGSGASRHARYAGNSGTEQIRQGGFRYPNSSKLSIRSKSHRNIKYKK